MDFLSAGRATIFRSDATGYVGLVFFALASGSSKLTHKKQLLRRWGKQVGAECSALLRKPFVLYDHPN